MIDAVRIADQRIGETGEVDEAVPIGIVASEPGHLEAEHEADTGKRDFGRQTLEAGAYNGAGAGDAEILVDDNDAIVRPAKLARLGCKRVLSVGRSAIVLDLGGTSTGADRRWPVGRDGWLC
jgi:hypothetical protein